MKNIILFFFYLTTLTLASQSTIPKDSICADSLLNYSKQFLGTKYKYASCSSTNGFDCSGFVSFVFSHFKIKAPRSSIDYVNFGKTIPLDSCKIGDVIVFTGTNAENRRAGHVGIIISNLGEELQFIHSSSNTKHGGVKISSFKESPYYKVRFIKIIRFVTIY